MVEGVKSWCAAPDLEMSVEPVAHVRCKAWPGWSRRALRIRPDCDGAAGRARDPAGKHRTA